MNNSVSIIPLPPPILFAAVPITLANKRWRYATALCELDVKKGWDKVGRESEKRGG